MSRPSIIGVGMDMVATRRVAKLQRQFGTEFEARILSESERHVLSAIADGRQGQWIAKRFAAKEALAKALGCGIGAKASFTDIATTHNQDGQPQMVLTGAAAHTAKELAGGAYDIHISLGDTEELAYAMVVVERRD